MKEKIQENLEEKETKIQLITHEQYINLRIEAMIELLTELNKKVDELSKLAKE